MGESLAEYAIDRNNNFNLIRFLSAILVIFSHSFPLTGAANNEPLNAIVGMTWGEVAVDIFFITSGFLITGSYFSRGNLLAFVWARFLRIYPALIVAVIFNVLVIGMCFTSFSVHEYLLNDQTKKFFLKNISLFFGVEFSLPGVFLDVPYRGVVNGSLWTLPYEVRMYAILALVLGLGAFISKRTKCITFRRISLLIGFFSICLHLFNPFPDTLPSHATRLFYMFFVGAAFFIWKDKIILSSRAALLGLIILLLSALNRELFNSVYCVIIPYLILYSAYVPSGQIRKFNNYGDYSYGIYIYAFAAQQPLAQMVPGISVLTMTFMSILLTLPLAVFSWHLIEKPFLGMKGSYVLVENIVRVIGRRMRVAQTQ
jgi:peptidoglycan/LPS O-acetylase OafA/YrhL